MAHNNLDKLWGLADLEGSRIGINPDSAFDSIGLILVRPLGSVDYDSTPANVSSFARTGGDGVHYSLLEFDGAITDESPVVMTAPMMFATPNLIIGENLYDFLCLGMRTSYFWLEQLVYDRAQTILQLEHPELVFVSDYGENYQDNLAYQENERLLELFRTGFDLKPWIDFEKHLAILNEKYLSSLQFFKKRT